MNSTTYEVYLPSSEFEDGPIYIREKESDARRLAKSLVESGHKQVKLQRVTREEVPL